MRVATLNEQAAQIISGELPAIAAENANWAAFSVEMRFEKWKGERKAETERSPTVGEVIAGKVRTALRRVKRAVKKYAEAQRVFGLTALGFSPRPRKTAQLPKAEYASVMSAINSNYHARLEGQSLEQIAVGDYLYSFEISKFDEYRIIERRAIR